MVVIDHSSQAQTITGENTEEHNELWKWLEFALLANTLSSLLIIFSSDTSASKKVIMSTVFASCKVKASVLTMKRHLHLQSLHSAEYTLEHSVAVCCPITISLVTITRRCSVVQGRKGAQSMAHRLLLNGRGSTRLLSKPDI